VSLRSGSLVGAQHPDLGAIDTIAEGACAIAISRGGANKVYDHIDPNEDCALFATGAGGSLLAVADGHHGSHGAQAAIEALARETAPAACASNSPAQAEGSWADWLYAELQRTNAAVVTDAVQRNLAPAPTTLCVVVIRPAEEEWSWAAVGDSHIFRFDSTAAQDFGWQASPDRRGRAHFIGVDEEPWHRANTALGWAPLGDTEAIVLATDGLSERSIGLEDPAAGVAAAVAGAREIPEPRRAQWLARDIAARANTAHCEHKSGDNVAAAVWIR